MREKRVKNPQFKFHFVLNMRRKINLKKYKNLFFPKEFAKKKVLPPPDHFPDPCKVDDIPSEFFHSHSTVKLDWILGLLNLSALIYFHPYCLKKNHE